MTFSLSLSLSFYSTALLSFIANSHLHLAICNNHAARAKGVWGPYNGAPLQGLRFAEGGQSSTGSSLAWFRRMINSQITSQTPLQHTTGQVSQASSAQQPTGCAAGTSSSSPSSATTGGGGGGGVSTSSPIAPASAPALVSYASLDTEASLIPIGAEGLLAIETFQVHQSPFVLA